MTISNWQGYRNWKPFIAGGNANGLITLKTNLVVYYRVKHTLTIWPSNSSPKDLPKRNQNMSTQIPAHECA